MSADYEPGTVAVVTFSSGATERSVRRGGVWVLLDREGYGIDAYVTDVRPLVVLDLSDWTAETVASIPAWLRSKCSDAPSESAVRHIAGQIESRTRRPKPPEPTGLGAVVALRGTIPAVRTLIDAPDGKNWQVGAERIAWDDLAAVKVLAEGVPSC